MTVFKHRSIDSSRTLGDRLRAHREQADTLLDEASRATSISLKYLAAIEESAYQRLPGDVYTRNFLKKYAIFLKLNPNDVIAHYDQESGVIKTFVESGPRFVQRHVDEKPVYTPRRLRLIGLSVLIIVIVTYLAWQVWSIIRPPRLILDSPVPGLSTIERSVEVRGTAERESEVTINGQSVLVDGNGQFVESIDLHPGLNTIQVVAARKRSRSQTILRQVLVQATSE